MPKVSQLPGSTQSEIICLKHQWGDGVTISADGKTRTEKEANAVPTLINSFLCSDYEYTLTNEVPVLWFNPAPTFKKLRHDFYYVSSDFY